MGWELIPAIIGGATSIGSGIKGKGAANKADQRQAQQDERGNLMMDTGMGMMKDFQNQAQNFLNGGGPGADLMDQARTGGSQLQDKLGGLAGQLEGATPTFDFEQGSNTMDQAMAGFDQFATGARANAREQAGQSVTAGSDSLDAALASRGISRNSGVAAGAMGDIMAQGSQGMVNLERDLANQGAQMGLDATKFDVNRLMQEQQMGSQFALGAGAQRGQNLGMAGNLYGQAYQAPLQMQQQMFQQNQMQPYMQLMGMSNPMDFINMAFGGGQQATAQAGQNAAAGGAGFGSGMAGLTSNMWDYLSNKNSGTTQPPSNPYNPSNVA